MSSKAKKERKTNKITTFWPKYKTRLKERINQSQSKQRQLFILMTSIYYKWNKTKSSKTNREHR